MFGLMRPEGGCSASRHPNYLHHRMHYCGTCKVVGKKYGQSARFLQNFDTVFLSELLSAIHQEDLQQWQGAFQAINKCFTLPEKNSKLPIPLHYAATVNIFLGELKIDDNIKDQGRWRWKWAKRLFSKSFHKANQQLLTWNIDTKQFWDWVTVQEQREKEQSIGFMQLNELLIHYAEPTAQMTAAIFKEGVRLGKENTTHNQDLMQQLGRQFGQLMYILDAFEDVEKDIHQKQFNPLVLYFNANKTLSAPQFEQVRQLLLQLQQQIQATIALLPINKVQQDLYSSRVASNLAMRIYKKRTIPSTWQERITLRWKNAQEFAFQLTCQTNSWTRKANYYLVSVAVFLAPQTTEFLPQEAKTEVFQWTAFITAFLASIGILGVISKKHREEQRKLKKENRQQKKFRKRIKDFFHSLKKVFTKKKDSRSCCDGCGGNCCSGDCCNGCDNGGLWASCCAGCCATCCGAACESGCNNCTENCCDPDSPWFWVILFLFILLVAAGILALIFLL